MADSVRQKIIDAVRARMETIQIANGYQTEIGNRVFVWYAKPLEQRFKYALNIKDVSEETEEQLTSIHTHTLTIELNLMVKKDTLTADECRSAIADIITAVGSDRYWNFNSERLVFHTAIRGNTMQLEQNGETAAGASVSLELKYRTASFDPYTLR